MDSSSPRDKICSGCITYIEPITKESQVECTEYIICNIKPFHAGVNCPCSTCLVKMVCEHPCDKLDKYTDTFRFSEEYMVWLWKNDINSKN